MLLVILFYKVPAVFNIFVVKYKSCFPIDTIDSLSRNFPFSVSQQWVATISEGAVLFSHCAFLRFQEIFHTFKLHGIWRFIFKNNIG